VPDNKLGPSKLKLGEDEDSKSQGSNQSGSQQSSCSNNSRAHMYKVSQINFVKKSNGMFSDNYDVKEQLG